MLVDTIDYKGSDKRGKDNERLNSLRCRGGCDEGVRRGGCGEGVRRGGVYGGSGFSDEFRRKKTGLKPKNIDLNKPHEGSYRKFLRGGAVINNDTSSEDEDDNETFSNERPESSILTELGIRPYVPGPIFGLNINEPPASSRQTEVDNPPRREGRVFGRDINEPPVSSTRSRINPLSQVGRALNRHGSERQGFLPGIDYPLYRGIEPVFGRNINEPPASSTRS